MTPVLGGLLTCACMMTWVTESHADRRTGLGGNFLIEDTDDIFVFPQRMSKLGKNLLMFDMGATQEQGNGVFVWKLNQSAYLGLALHRADATEPGGVTTGNDGPLGLNHDLNLQGGVQSPLQFFVSPNTGEALFTQTEGVMDLMYGTDRFGLRLSLGQGRSNFEPEDGDSTENSQWYLMLQAGYSDEGPKLRYDLSVYGLIASGTDKAFGDEAQGTALNLGSIARAYLDIDGPAELGLFGRLAYNGLGLEIDRDVGPDDKANLTFVDVVVGAGPVFTDKDKKHSIAAYAFVRYLDLDTDSAFFNTVQSALVRPGAAIAAEVTLLSWLQFRSGMQYLMALTSNTEAGDTVEGSQSTFGWNAGLGFLVGDFRFDGALQHQWLLNGPNFLGGGQGMFGLVSMRYLF